MKPYTYGKTNGFDGQMCFLPYGRHTSAFRSRFPGMSSATRATARLTTTFRTRTRRIDVQHASLLSPALGRWDKRSPGHLHSMQQQYRGEKTAGQVTRIRGEVL